MTTAVEYGLNRVGGGVDGHRYGTWTCGRLTRVWRGCGKAGWVAADGAAAVWTACGVSGYAGVCGSDDFLCCR